MMHMMLVGLLMAQAAQAPAIAVQAADALTLITGDWQIVDTQTGKISQDCKQAQHFQLTPDRRNVVLTEPWANFTANYLVVHNEESRVLMFITNEERLTDQGDPVLWWADFEGRDKFRWRRYDWPSSNATDGEWQRCPVPGSGLSR